MAGAGFLSLGSVEYSEEWSMFEVCASEKLRWFSELAWVNRPTVVVCGNGGGGWCNLRCLYQPARLVCRSPTCGRPLAANHPISLSQSSTCRKYRRPLAATSAPQQLLSTGASESVRTAVSACTRFPQATSKQRHSRLWPPAVVLHMMRFQFLNSGAARATCRTAVQ